MTTIIHRNTTFPTHEKDIFNFFNDNNFVAIKIYEGENSFARDNVLLGKINFTGIQPFRSKGLVSIHEKNQKLKLYSVLTVTFH